MKSPWQIWSLYLICLVAVSIAMSWLSLKTVRLDALRETDRAETELARREAELQERISSALYRMDLRMLPIVTQEAARPVYLYQSFYSVSEPAGRVENVPQQTANDAPDLQLPSPLLFHSSPSVLLHFQINTNNNITSPEFPVDQDLLTAVRDYQFDQAALHQTSAKIERAQRLFAYPSLLQACIAMEGVSQHTSETPFQDTNPPLVTYNVPDVENFRNQLQNQSFDPTTNAPSNKLDAQRLRGMQRVNEEFNSRRDSTQEFTQQSLANNTFAYGNVIGNGSSGPFAKLDVASALSAEALQTVPMQPMWLEENLILARRANTNQGAVLQCCWLNWEQIKTDLQREVADLLPDVDFEPVTPDTELKIGTALATIPVQLIVDRPKLLARMAFDSSTVTSKSVIPLSLIAAWFCMGLAAVASASLLYGILRLSERRAAFVSAVTHELRTPLTTFRMYSEMLAEGMVPLEKQRHYANTLKIQADRLSHLVENVLQFARLERGPAKNANECLTIDELLLRFQSRLEERAADGQMQLIVDVEQSIAQYSLATQPAAIEQILFNLVDNACKYAQSSDDKRIVLSVGDSKGHIQFGVRDFGPGISPMERKRMFQPFHQSKLATSNAVPGVGLGLALCTRMASSLGGRLLNKDYPIGTMFVLELPKS
ncbi:MAG: HAMP domain-containing histidine kinase [Planctomycetales bacterium]|nr:HAMP domain-containing histidine kinase [Planctomycetales bacterium]